MLLGNAADGLVSYKHAAFCFTLHSLMDWSCVAYLWIFVKNLALIVDLEF